MSKIPDQNAAALSMAKTIKSHSSRQAPKKPPKAASNDFSAIAQGYIQAATAESTRRNFESDMRHLAINGVFAESPPAAVLEYLAKYAGNHKIGTLERRMVSLGKAAIRKNLPSAVKSLPVKQALAGIRRTHGVRPRRVAPVIKETLLTMLIVSEQVQKPLAFARDKAVLLLSFCGALRRSEACALEVTDLKFLDEGMDVLIRRSKTDRDGRGQTIFVPKANGSRCAVAAVQEWLALAQIVEGSVFRAVSRSDRVLPGTLSPQSVALIVKRAAARIGANADDFSGHSLRAGFCTEGSIAGLANWQIRAVTRHVNDVHLATYVRPLSNKTPSLL
nr:site-specific integrase [uncultured Rhodoferax sp.]